MVEMQSETRAAAASARQTVARAIAAAREMMRFDRRGGLAALNELFHAGTPPGNYSAPPEGDYAGELVVLDMKPGLTELFSGAAGLYMPWLGKTFFPAQNTGDNRFALDSLPLARLFWPMYGRFQTNGRGEYHAFRFRTSLAPGLMDRDLTVLRLDYDLPENPLRSVRRVVDELVEVADGLYLGKAHLHWWQGEWQTVAYFTLRRAEDWELRADSPMRTFDPARVAHFEKENWVAYYNREWNKLLQMSVGMVKYAFGLPWPLAAYGAFLVARAEMAAAPYPDNDIPTAEAYMRRFYGLVRRVHHEAFDVAQAARLEVNWWVVHRKLFGKTENEPLVQALTDLYAAAYTVPPERVREAAAFRAEAMVYSDRWVNEGRPANSPLLAQEEEALYKSYAALRRAVQPGSRG